MAFCKKVLNLSLRASDSRCGDTSEKAPSLAEGLPLKAPSLAEGVGGGSVSLRADEIGVAVLRSKNVLARIFIKELLNSRREFLRKV